MNRETEENRVAFFIEIRLMLEELCCALLRFEHSVEGRWSEVAIRREVPLGVPNAYADVIVSPREEPPYCFEVDFGYSNEEILSSVRRKYRHLNQEVLSVPHFRKLVLFFDCCGREGVDELLQACREALGPRVSLEVMDEKQVNQLAKKHLGISIPPFERFALADIRSAIDQAKGKRAFALVDGEEYRHDPLRAHLLWSFDFLKIQRLIGLGRLPQEMLKVGVYPRTVVLMADLCCFSSFVRETPDPEVTRANLVSFYSKARYAIIGNGGFLYQFVGDSVIGCFGMYEDEDDSVEAALRAATELCHVGASVTHRWQRQIDREQPYHGSHIGIAMGDVHLIPLRPFSRTHQGLVGDCINMSARLMGEAKEGEIIVSNVFYQNLGPDSQQRFEASTSVEAKNVGRIKSWITKIDSGMP
jgi:class 3 adenylate cyclase